MTTAAAETPPSAQPAGSSATAGAAAVAPPRRRLLLVLSVVGLLLLLALAALAWQLNRYDEVNDSRQAAIAAASQSALNLTSIDKDDFQADVDRVLEGSTGAFKKDFEARSKQLAEVLTQNEVSSEGKVIDAGLVRHDAVSATALVVVDSNVRNVAAPEGRVNTYRMRLQLERRDGRWLTSMLEFVG